MKGPTILAPLSRESSALQAINRLDKAMKGLPLLVSFPATRESIEYIGKELSWSSVEVSEALKLFKRGLPPLVDTYTLPYLFGISAKLVSVMGKFPGKYYRIFSILKSGGGQRQIEAPRRFLKIIQRWVHQHVLATQPLHPAVFGFVKGRNIFGNARVHVSSRNLMVLDIADFFPSISIARVQDVFLGIGFQYPVACQLASLCTLDGRLPQGAPTSPSLANLVFEPVDEQVLSLSKAWQCHYTRYADDLAFSGSRKFKMSDVVAIGKILHQYGFALQKAKSRIVGLGGRKIVAGLVVNEKPQPPRYTRRLWRAVFNRAERHPREFATRAGYLMGLAAVVHQYDPKLAAKYEKIAHAVC